MWFCPRIQAFWSPVLEILYWTKFSNQYDCQKLDYCAFDQTNQCSWQEPKRTLYLRPISVMIMPLLLLLASYLLLKWAIVFISAGSQWHPWSLKVYKYVHWLHALAVFFNDDYGDFLQAVRFHFVACWWHIFNFLGILAPRQRSLPPAFPSTSCDFPRAF